MADALVERRARAPARFFCHRCSTEFEDVSQDFTCPYCASGFIEQLESEDGHEGEDFSDADMSNLDEMSTIDENLDDSDDLHQSTPPVLNDLAFLMSGGRLRGTGRRETLMETLVWMIGGARPGGGASPGGGGANGSPFVLVGAPGDYVFGGEGLDAVVTQLLGQLENAGPPPLSRDAIAALPSETVTEEQAAANTSCSVCWDSFQAGETVSKLACDHIFHTSCIAPWLQLHATCPICRRSLLPAEEAPVEQDQEAPSTPRESSTTRRVRCVLRRVGAGSGQMSSSSDSSNSSMGSMRAPPSATASVSDTSADSLLSSDRTHDMEIDIDIDTD